MDQFLFITKEHTDEGFPVGFGLVDAADGYVAAAMAKQHLEENHASGEEFSVRLYRVERAAGGGVATVRCRHDRTFKMPDDRPRSPLEAGESCEQCPEPAVEYVSTADGDVPLCPEHIAAIADAAARDTGEAERAGAKTSDS